MLSYYAVRDVDRASLRLMAENAHHAAEQFAAMNDGAASRDVETDLDFDGRELSWPEFQARLIDAGCAEVSASAEWCLWLHVTSVEIGGSRHPIIRYAGRRYIVPVATDDGEYIVLRLAREQYTPATPTRWDAMFVARLRGGEWTILRRLPEWRAWGASLSDIPPALAVSTIPLYVALQRASDDHGPTALWTDGVSEGRAADFLAEIVSDHDAQPDHDSGPCGPCSCREYENRIVVYDGTSIAASDDGLTRLRLTGRRDRGRPYDRPAMSA